MATIKDKKLAFVHIPRTGGVSFILSLNMVGDGHWKASEYPHNYHKFTIIRHPIDRFISRVAYLKNIHQLYHKHIPPSYEIVKNLNINEIADMFQTLNDPAFLPIHHYLDEEIEIFRDVETAYNVISKRYNIKSEKLVCENKSPVKETLTNIQPVIDYYKKDFELFNYKI